MIRFGHSVPKPNYLTVTMLQDTVNVKNIIYLHKFAFNISIKSQRFKENCFLFGADTYFQAKVAKNRKYEKVVRYWDK